MGYSNLNCDIFNKDCINIMKCKYGIIRKYQPSNTLRVQLRSSMLQDIHAVLKIRAIL